MLQYYKYKDIASKTRNKTIFCVLVFSVTYVISNEQNQPLFPYCDVYTKIFMQAKKPGTFLHEQTGKAEPILRVTAQRLFSGVTQ